MVRAENISFAVGKKILLKPTSVAFEEGKFTVVMGANGAGKSTLLKVLSGDLQPSTGSVFLDEKPLPSYSKKELATKRAVLSQHYHLAFPITVADVVLMGRYPFYNTHPSSSDKAICREAMELMEMDSFADRDYTTLSGGEAQKAQMSRVLAQIWSGGEGGKKVLFLDEPVSHLDVKYQYQLMHIAKDCCRQNTTVIAVLHDINLAISFADKLLLMKNGELRYAVADPAQITPAMIGDIFSVAATILHETQHAKPVVIF